VCIPGIIFECTTQEFVLDFFQSSDHLSFIREEERFSLVRYLGIVSSQSNCFFNVSMNSRKSTIYHPITNSIDSCMYFLMSDACLAYDVIYLLEDCYCYIPRQCLNYFPAFHQSLWKLSSIVINNLFSLTMT
jgi:hypothetical protein